MQCIIDPIYETLSLRDTMNCCLIYYYINEQIVIVKRNLFTVKMIER